MKIISQAITQLLKNNACIQILVSSFAYLKVKFMKYFSFKSLWSSNDSLNFKMQ